MDTSLPCRVFTVRFAQLDRWKQPETLFDVGKLPRDWRVVRIGTIARLITGREKVDQLREYKLAGVKWYAEGVFHRETVKGSDTSATQLAPLVPRALIYNRLFAWKASFAVVQPKHAGMYVSGEFPQFEFDPSVALPEFIYLFTTLPRTITAVNARSIGSAAVSRNRFKEEEFLALEMPLPPLATQRAIVKHWGKAQTQIANALSAADEAQRKAEANFLHSIGFDLRQPAAQLPKIFAAHWENVGRWSVSSNRQAINAVNLHVGKYHVVQLGSILKLVQYGTSAKANTVGHGVPILRINNIKDGAIGFGDLKHIELPQRAVEQLKLADGDMLVIRTSGSRDLVGRTAVFHETATYVFASYLIRMRFNDNTNSDYISAFLNSAVGRRQIDAVSRQIMQNNINSQELRSLEVPLPPLQIQRKLVDELARAQAVVTQSRKRATELRAQSALEVERQIFQPQSGRTAQALRLHSFGNRISVGKAVTGK
ncbi:MAG: restriction endonuclease subunit S [Candidatus Udaeobacter sp.]